MRLLSFGKPDLHKALFMKVDSWILCFVGSSLAAECRQAERYAKQPMSLVLQSQDIAILLGGLRH